jgi:hypothetical protein
MPDRILWAWSMRFIVRHKDTQEVTARVYVFLLIGKRSLNFSNMKWIMLIFVYRSNIPIWINSCASMFIGQIFQYEVIHMPLCFIGIRELYYTMSGPWALLILSNYCMSCCKFCWHLLLKLEETEIYYSVKYWKLLLVNVNKCDTF